MANQSDDVIKRDGTQPPRELPRRTDWTTCLADGRRVHPRGGGRRTRTPDLFDRRSLTNKPSHLDAVREPIWFNRNPASMSRSRDPPSTPGSASGWNVLRRPAPGPQVTQHARHRWPVRAHSRSSVQLQSADGCRSVSPSPGRGPANSSTPSAGSRNNAPHRSNSSSSPAVRNRPRLGDHRPTG